MFYSRLFFSGIILFWENNFLFYLMGSGLELMRTVVNLHIEMWIRVMKLVWWETDFR